MSSLQQRLAALTPQQRNALLGKLAAAGQAAARADTPPAPADDGALAPAQQRMWLFDSVEGDSAAYNIASVLRLRGRLDAGALEAALNHLVRRHEILRTRFVEVDGVARQEVLAAQPLTLERVALAPDAGPAALDAAIDGLLTRGFRLERGPLLRATAIAVDEDDTVLVAVLHHIVADGWSLRLIETELSAAYGAALEGRELVAPAVPQYREYVRWQRDWLRAGAPRQLDYWRTRLAGAPACWPMPCARPRDGAGLEAASLMFELPPGLCDGARRLAEAESGSTFMVLAAAFKLVLGHFAGTRDISIGTPVANRRERRFDGMIGMCSNTVVLRSRIGDGTFRDYLRQVRQVALGAFSHQDVPFEQVVDTLRPERSSAYPPLFQVLFALQSTESSALALPGLRIEAVQLPRRASEFDLIFEFFLDGDGADHAVLTWRGALFERAGVQRMHDCFVTLLTRAVAAPDTPLADLLAAAAPAAEHGAGAAGVDLLAAHCPLRADDRVWIAPGLPADMERAARAWCAAAGATPAAHAGDGATVLVLGPAQTQPPPARCRLVLTHGAAPSAAATASGAALWRCWSDPLAAGPFLLQAPDGAVHHGGRLSCVNALGDALPLDARGLLRWTGAAGVLSTGLAGRLTADGARLDALAPDHGWLNGHRVDCAAVEAALLRIPAVGAAVLLARADRAGVWRGVAYVVLNQKIEPRLLAAILSEQLPAAWVPAGFVAVNHIPYLRDGRVDGVALARLPVLNDGACAALASSAGLAPDDVGVGWITPAAAPELKLERAPRVARPAEAAAVAVAEGMAGVAGGADLPVSLAHGPELPAPACALSLAAMLARAAELHGDHGITYLDGGAAPAATQTYRELLAAAGAVLTGLRAHGVRPGDRVLLQLDDRRQMLTAFWGCVLAGALPIAAAVPASHADGDKDFEKIVNAWPVLTPALVVVGGAADDARAAGAALARRLGLATLPAAHVDALGAGAAGTDWHAGAPDDTALLLLTSGSTGTPKAVRQSHRALISRSAATAHGFAFDSAVVSFNWMPLDHVGGLVMFHLLDVYLGANQIQCPTAAILAQPLRWLECLSRHRVTNTWAPNFAYALVNELLDGDGAPRYQLDALDFILNGGESIVPRTARTFLRRLAPHGLRGDAMKPAWGMSETCSGVTFNAGFTLDNGSDDDAFVAVGAPIAGVALRVVDGADRPLPEGSEGRLQIRGAAVTAGYFNNPRANDESFTADGWYITGDLALLRGGRLTITGREKDVIIVNGLNYYGHEIEQIAETVPDVLEAHVAACAVRAAGHDTDRLAVFFSIHARAASEPERVGRALRQAVLGRAGIVPTFVVLLAPEEFPRTSIGKIQRLQLAQRFNAGEFDARLDPAAAAGVPAWFLAPAWLPVARPPARGPRAPVVLVGAARAEALASALRGDGARVARADFGAGFERLGADHFVVAAGGADDFVRMLAELRAETGAGWHVVHCGAARAPLPAARLVGAWDAAHAEALFSVAALGRAIARTPSLEVAALDVVTEAAFAVDAGEPVAAEHATLQGFVRSLAAELPAVRCRQIDVEADAGADDGGTGGAPQARLAAEIAAGGHDVVALRGARRLVQVLRPCGPEQAPRAPAGPGWCVITGGLGGIGAVLAEWLLGHSELNLLVLGRSRPDQLEPARRAVHARLAAYGGRYVYAAQDVCDGAGLAARLEESARRWSAPLRQVFHLAGTLREAAVAALDDGQVSQALRAKALGAAVLHEVLAARPDVEIVHFGSANGFFGGAGVAAYAAANSMLDGLAAARRGQGGACRCLHWSMWDELGMSQGYAMKALSAARGFAPLTSAQGLDSLCVALAIDAGSVVIGADRANPNIGRYVDQPLAASWTLLAPAGAGHAAARPCDDFGTPLEAVVNDGRGGAGSGAADGAGGAPLTALEQRLAAVWRDVLRVAVDSAAVNFFELGGDSIMAIQVVARAGKAGIGLAPRAVFECQTLGELALAATDENGGADANGDAGADPAPALTGPVPLAPIQSWFFAQRFAGRHHMNQSVLLRPGRRVGQEPLRQALEAVARQHDMLRARYADQADGVAQSLVDDLSVPLRVVPLAYADQAGHAAALAAAGDALQGGLDLANGPVVLAAYLQGHTEADDRLLIVAHHLVVDGISWRILVDDLEHCIGEAAQGRAPRLGRKSSAYGDWVASVRGQAAAATSSALAYWRAAGAQACALPAPAAGANLRGAERAIELRLDPGLTATLLTALPAAHGVGPNDVLLAALYHAYRAWAGSRRMLLTLEGHGRGGAAHDIDLSRTVGWFTAMFPALFECDAGTPIAALPAAMHAQLAAVPDEGRLYLALRHGGDAATAAALAAGHQPRISFNYLGRFDVEEGRLLRFATEAPGAQIAPGQQRCHEIDIVGAVVDGALRMSFIYGGERYEPAVIEPLVDGFEAALRALAAQSPARLPAWTAQWPSLPDQLARHGIAADAVESVAPMTPMQAGLIYESQVSGVAGTYVSHLVNELGGELDAAALRRAWDAVVLRHDIYRTAFVPAQVGGFVQAVLRTAAVPWVELDWSALPEAQQEARFERLLEDDARAGFDLQRAPLLRIHVVRMAPDRHRMLVSEHHCVSDGWSRGVVLAEVAALYRGGAAAAALEAPVPFARYADWLRGLDTLRARAYWDEALRGAEPMPEYGCQALPGEEEGSAAVQRRHSLRLPAALGARLAETARARRITLGALVQAAWCWTMAGHTARRDVNFLTVHAGRPNALDGVERIVGPLICAVPVRVDLAAHPSVIETARALQRMQIDRAEHGFLPLVQSCAGMARDGMHAAFNTLFVFENFPVTAPQPAEGELAVLWVNSIDRSDLPLSVMVVPGERMEVVFYSRADCFDAAAVEALGACYERVLQLAAAEPELDAGVERWMDDADRAAQAARLAQHAAHRNGGAVDFEF
jgi:non-ribosomal peptide synthase protein (TIGR01720 family)